VLVLAGLLVNLGYHLPNGHLDASSAVVVAVLLGIVWVILWYQRRKKGVALLENLDAVNRPSNIFWLFGAAIFVIAGAFGHQFARTPQTGDPVAWWSAIFTAFGVVWLPALTLVIGARAWSRQARAFRL
jgi:ABC-type dipeptide/oligopeptide/nickel transport system permease component